ncbi:MAG TPA: hypothetical protein VFD97_08805 [Acidimicrobiia bacterium]|nr:hypothetical protein [Acidimicrobiia bacterium]
MKTGPGRAELWKGAFTIASGARLRAAIGDLLGLRAVVVNCGNGHRDPVAPADRSIDHAAPIEWEQLTRSST